jgi:hypothetical protein
MSKPGIDSIEFGIVKFIGSSTPPTEEEIVECRRVHALRLEAMECAECIAMPSQSWKTVYPMIPMNPCPKHHDAGYKYATAGGVRISR